MDSFKEEIVGGVSSEFILSDHNGWKFTLPAQFLAYHRGGQIDVLKQVNTTTLFSGATRSKLHKNI